MISPSGMSVLEWMPSEAFRSAYLAGDKDRLRAATVFAEFPGGGGTVGGWQEDPSLPPCTPLAEYPERELSAKMALTLDRCQVLLQRRLPTQSWATTARAPGPHSKGRERV